jgi:hypothetical protein
MRGYAILILIAFSISCSNQRREYTFTEEQIASLHLDSTTILQVKNESAIKIDLNSFLEKDKHFDFGSLIKEINLIPLETTDESLIGHIMKIVVTDSNIYIMDSLKGGGLVIFDREGKFIKRISNGSGPGELIRLFDIAYDFENNELIAYQHSYLLHFTPSGEFVRQVRLPFGFYNFTVIPEGYLFKTLDRQGNSHLGHLEDYTLLVTDKDFKLKSVGMFNPPNDIHYGGYNYLYNNEGTVKITQTYTDTIYQYLNLTNELKATYIIDYNNKKLPTHYLKGTNSDFEEAINQNNYFYYLGEYLETKSQSVFFLRNNYTRLTTVVYMDRISQQLIGGTNADYKTKDIPPIGFPKAVWGNYFISSYLPNPNDTLLYNSSVISDTDKYKIRKINEDDNPVLAFFRLKSF